jgi:hypothetical protein
VSDVIFRVLVEYIGLVLFVGFHLLLGWDGLDRESFRVVACCLLLGLFLVGVSLLGLLFYSGVTL